MDDGEGHQAGWSLAAPRPARVFAPVRAPRCSVPGYSPAVAASTYGLGSPSLAGSERLGGRPGVREREPLPRAQVSVPPRMGPAAGHTCQLGELQTGQPRIVSG